MGGCTKRGSQLSLVLVVWMFSSSGWLNGDVEDGAKPSIGRENPSLPVSAQP